MADANSNVQKELLLSKKKQQKLYQKQNIFFLQEQIFTSGHTVRLLHKLVHIQVNLGTDHTYDMAAAGPVKKALKPPELNPEMTWVPIRICDDTIEDRKRRNCDRVLSWKSWSGNTVWLQLTSIHGQYDVVDKTDSHVQATSVIYYPSFDTREKCDTKTDAMFRMYEITRAKNKKNYSQLMKDWRKDWRAWEANLIEHEFFNCWNLKIFCPGTTPEAICAAIFLVKEDNWWEEKSFFADDLTEEPSEQCKKMKIVLIRGTELLATDSDQSDEEAIEAQWRKRLEKAMILDKHEKNDIVGLIMGYTLESERTEIWLSLNPSHADLQDHLNTQLKEGKAFAQWVYTELLKRRRTYDIVDRAAVQTRSHVLDVNEMCYNDWFEPQQLQ